MARRKETRNRQSTYKKIADVAKLISKPLKPLTNFLTKVWSNIISSVSAIPGVLTFGRKGYLHLAEMTMAEQVRNSYSKDSLENAIKTGDLKDVSKMSEKEKEDYLMQEAISGTGKTTKEAAAAQIKGEKAQLDIIKSGDMKAIAGLAKSDYITEQAAKQIVRMDQKKFRKIERLLINNKKCQEFYGLTEMLSKRDDNYIKAGIVQFTSKNDALKILKENPDTDVWKAAALRTEDAVLKEVVENGPNIKDINSVIASKGECSSLCALIQTRSKDLTKKDFDKIIERGNIQVKAVIESEIQKGNIILTDSQKENLASIDDVNSVKERASTVKNQHDIALYALDARPEVRLAALDNPNCPSVVHKQLIAEGEKNNEVLNKIASEGSKRTLSAMLKMDNIVKKTDVMAIIAKRNLEELHKDGASIAELSIANEMIKNAKILQEAVFNNNTELIHDICEMQHDDVKISQEALLVQNDAITDETLTEIVKYADNKTLSHLIDSISLEDNRIANHKSAFADHPKAMIAALEKCTDKQAVTMSKLVDFNAYPDVMITAIQKHPDAFKDACIKCMESDNKELQNVAIKNAHKSDVLYLLTKNKNTDVALTAASRNEREINSYLISDNNPEVVTKLPIYCRNREQLSEVFAKTSVDDINKTIDQLDNAKDKTNYMIAMAACCTTDKITNYIQESGNLDLLDHCSPQVLELVKGKTTEEVIKSKINNLQKKNSFDDAKAYNGQNSFRQKRNNQKSTRVKQNIQKDHTYKEYGER